MSEEETFGVAVVGMAGKFPGADSVDALWNNLADGVESITRFAPDRLDGSIPAELRNDPDYVPARGVLEGAERFDAAFFGISSREAELMDPQARVFLQTSWEALEAAGYCPEGFEGLIGVFAGMANNSYYLNSVLPRPDIVRRLGEFQTMLANEKDFLATRVSHKLDLTGPSISMYTGCSTSLVAICQAFHSLASYQCDMALAGGVCVTWPQNSGYLYAEDGIESRDGHCRPFDAAASGTIFSNGVGIVVLKRLEDALADGDHIHAVVRGAALNNDGAGKVSFAAPSIQGQADVIAMAQAQADIDPSTVTYVEAHGTATQLGDPVEFEGLKAAFQHPRHGRQYCALGSVKSNFGHLLAAAGVTGFIKTVLALEHRKLPPTLHYTAPNPAIDFDNSPFFVNTELRDWNPSGPRRAGVSSFGIGGTNAHVVLEEAPAEAPRGANDIPQLLLVSARDANALERAAANLAETLSAGEQAPLLADAAYTLQVGRRSFPHRLAAVAGSPAAAAKELRACGADPHTVAHCDTDNPDIAFIFPGQGTQYPRMTRSLYRNAPAFTETFDRCAEIVRGHGDVDLVGGLYENAGAGEIAAPGLGHAALFAAEYALARALMSWGIAPKTLVGFSIGELVAACVAGVLSEEDALSLVMARSEALGAGGDGGMLAVRLAADDLRELLPDGASVAADNAPLLSVAAGDEQALGKLAAMLEDRNVPHREIPATHPFHTELLADTVAAVVPTAERLRYSRPRIPMISTVTGSFINPQQVADPAYWARHHCAPVQFQAAIRTLGDGNTSFALEVGPGDTLSGCVHATLRGSGPRTAPTLPPEWVDDDREWGAMLTSLGRLWQSGASIDWNALHAEQPRRVALPTYPFAPTRHALDAVAREDWLRPREAGDQGTID